MPTGVRVPGVASGPAIPPRLLPTRNQEPPSGRLWVPHGSDSASASSDQAPASGIAGVQFATTGDLMWRVQRIAISTTSTASTTASVYVGSSDDPKNLVDISYDGNGDVADEINPILVPTSSVLLIVWSGMSLGSIASARLQYEQGTYQWGPV